jgi:hypothetical protein
MKLIIYAKEILGGGTVSATEDRGETENHGECQSLWHSLTLRFSVAYFKPDSYRVARYQILGNKSVCREDDKKLSY